jgi:hypothetical protein
VFESPRAIRSLAIAHFAASWFMVGLIWTIHYVHYPLFAEVGDATYVAFQAAHVERIGKLLFVPWLTEGATLLGILWVGFVGTHRNLRLPAAINAVAMAIVLVISGFWSAPAHGDLADGFDVAVHDRLMNANLLRTLAWTVCGIAALWILALLWNERRDERGSR